MENITLFHGSNQIVETPELSQGNIHNDYGRGFYCTRIEDMAKEWACKNQKDGFVNRYELDTDGLRILNLSDGNHTVLNWIAILLKNRTFRLRSPIAIDAILDRAFCNRHHRIRCHRRLPCKRFLFPVCRILRGKHLAATQSEPGIDAGQTRTANCPCI